MSRHPLGGALRVSEEPPRAAFLAGVERLWPGPFASQNENVGLNGSTQRRQGWDTQLAGALGKPHDHFFVQRDTGGAALLQLLGLRQPGIEDALLPWRRRRRAERL